MKSSPDRFTRRDAIKTFALAASAASISPSSLFADPIPNRKKLPNIVLLLSDDVGYGDVSCYGAKVVSTPNIDKLAANGQRFTDAHTGAATCTPSRYAVLTGEYAWRIPGAHILPGDAALLIDPARPTLPSQLKKAGYATGCVGKWHLGLGDGNIDWNGDIRPGPLEVGFDYSFIIPATPDRVPCVYIENHRVAGLDPKDPITVSYRHNIGTDPTGTEHPEMLKMKTSHGHNDTIVDGVSRIGFMSGGKSARWVDEVMAPTLVNKSIDFIEKNKERPFFLYLAASDIHVPHIPNNEFVNTTACGIRCDAIHQLDWTVGQIAHTLDRLGLTDDTLFIFTSDNGPVVDDGYADGSVEHLNGHRPAGALRGGKYTIWEGGTRVPFITSWPQQIKPGVSNALVGQVDLVASLSALAGVTTPATVPDSINVLPALLGKSPAGREYIVEEANVLAIRKGQWKLVDTRQKPGIPLASGADSDMSHFQLYDLSKDISESENVAHLHPELVHELAAKLEELRKLNHS